MYYPHQVQTEGFGCPCHKTSILHTDTAQWGSHHAICKVCFISKFKIINCCQACERAALCSRRISNESFCNAFQINTRSRASFIIMLVFSSMHKSWQTCAQLLSSVTVGTPEQILWQSVFVHAWTSLVCLLYSLGFDLKLRLRSDWFKLG